MRTLKQGLWRHMYFPLCVLLCLSMACPCRDCDGPGVCDNPEDCKPPECDKPEGCEPPECDDPDGCEPPECDDPDGCEPPECDDPDGCETPGLKMAPNLLISRHKPTASSVNAFLASLVNNGIYRLNEGEGGNAAWTTYANGSNQEGWVAIHVGDGMEQLPSRVLLNWHASGNPNYNNIQFGAPTEYSIEVSSNSTNGSDGSWTSMVDVSNNQVRTRTHLLEFAQGIAWVRMHIPLSGQTHLTWGAQLTEIDVYDATHLLETEGRAFLYDSWFFLGDSITAAAFNQTTAHGSFANNVKAQTQEQFFPVVVNGGIAHDTTRLVLARLDSALAEHPNIRFWAIGLGTNNIQTGSQQEQDNFYVEMLEIVRRIQQAGRIPVVANIPFNDVRQAPEDFHNETCTLARPATPAFNQVVERVIEETGALRGPDLYAYFEANCKQLGSAAEPMDGLHPGAEGYTQMNALWAQAVADIYKAYAP